VGSSSTREQLNVRLPRLPPSLLSCRLLPQLKPLCCCGTPRSAHDDLCQPPFGDESKTILQVIPRDAASAHRPTFASTIMSRRRGARCNRGDESRGRVGEQGSGRSFDSSSSRWWELRLVVGLQSGGSKILWRATVDHVFKQTRRGALPLTTKTYRRMAHERLAFSPAQPQSPKTPLLA
jgi:hypothetical protein